MRDFGPKALAVSPRYLRKQLFPSLGVRQTAVCRAFELHVVVMHAQSLEKCLGIQYPTLSLSEKFSLR